MGSFNDALLKQQQFLGGSAKQMLIDGKFVGGRSGRTFETINPTTGKTIASICEGEAADIDLAVTAARRALEGPWSRFTTKERSRLLSRLADLVERNYDEIMALDVLDMGMPIQRKAGMLGRSVDLLRYYAAAALNIHGDTIANSIPGDFTSYTLKEPIGVVGAITPWNSPPTSALWKIGPAIAAGCTVVLKPAEQSPLSSLRLAELVMEAGFPEGVVNIVPGGRAAGAALAEHSDVDKIAFTGSTAAGQKVIQASAGNLKRLTLELGGKSPNLIFADADLDAAVPSAAMAVFANSGQICSAGTRLFVEASVYDAFVDKVAAFGRTLRVGDPADPETQLGPLVSKDQWDRVGHYLEAGQSEGAVMLSGGLNVDEPGLADGYFVRPTVFSGVRDEMKIAQDEIFGPVISALPFSDIDDVIRRANASDFGLGGGVWTSNLKTAQRITRGLKTGSVWVNCYQMMDPAVPFGGYRMSGYGRESGREHIESYLNTKSIWINS
jgi:aldehyde dehydrogenase (NAD+)